MNKTPVTDTMCIIHTFHFTRKAVTAFTAWSHTTLHCDYITTKNISILSWCSLWRGNVSMKPKVLHRVLLITPGPKPTHGSSPSNRSKMLAYCLLAQKRCHQASCTSLGCQARFHIIQPYPAHQFQVCIITLLFSALNYHFICLCTAKITTTTPANGDCHSSNAQNQIKALS